MPPTPNPHSPASGAPAADDRARLPVLLGGSCCAAAGLERPALLGLLPAGAGGAAGEAGCALEERPPPRGFFFPAAPGASPSPAAPGISACCAAAPCCKTSSMPASGAVWIKGCGPSITSSCCDSPSPSSLCSLATAAPPSLPGSGARCCSPGRAAKPGGQPAGAVLASSRSEAALGARPLGACRRCAASGS